MTWNGIAEPTSKDSFLVTEVQRLGVLRNSVCLPNPGLSFQPMGRSMR